MQHPPQIVMGAITSTNPHLWLDMGSLDNSTRSYRIATSSPGVVWVSVNQFCSLLSIRWLQAKSQGTPPSPYGIGNFTDTEKIAMAQQLINYADLQAQITFAMQELGGTQSTLDTTVNSVTPGLNAYAVGTRIWAGNNNHVIAVYLSSATEYVLYDSNNGQTTVNQRTGFRAAMSTRGNDAFVVR